MNKNNKAVIISVVGLIQYGAGISLVSTTDMELIGGTLILLGSLWLGSLSWRSEE